MRHVYVLLDFLGCFTCGGAGFYWYDNRPMSLIFLSAVVVALLSRGFVRCRCGGPP